MAGSKHVAFLESLQVEHPSIAEYFARFADLYQRKLWHQLTLLLEEVIALPEFQIGDLLIQLYGSFVSDFAYKINLLKLAHIVTAVAKRYGDLQQAADFISEETAKLKEQKLPRSEQPLLYLNMQVAQYNLQMGEVTKCRDAISDGKASLDAFDDVGSPYRPLCSPIILPSVSFSVPLTI
jgi:26S proteasome regulatory subunit N9